MAYNLQSLIHAVHEALHLETPPVSGPENNLLELLRERATALKQILENLPLPTYNRLEMLQRQVIDLTHRTEHIVESAIVERVLMDPKSGHESSTSSDKETAAETFLQDLQSVIREFDSLISENLLTEELEGPTILDPTSESSSGVAGLPAKNIVSRKGEAKSEKCQGLDKDMHQLKDHLTRNPGAGIQVIPIVGMGGIGKTTLARKLYHDPLILSHFDCVAWATISQDYDVNAILQTLVSCLTGKEPSALSKQETVYNPQLTLHKALFGRRYLIVLDDVWDTNTWDRLRRSFPESQSAGTIMLTTRDLDVAAYASSSNLHRMHLLGDDDSWDLFSGEVFGKKEGLDPELERLGRKIVKNCKGLPLAISVISGLLSEFENTEGAWEHVADDICTAAALEDEQFSRILSLSYDHLPHHLRPCLLYIGAFPKGAEIRVSRVKRLWAAERFLKPIGNKTREEAAEEYLEALANRNLLQVHERKSCGKVKSYGMHDLVKDLCIRIADQEDFVVCSEYGHVTEALESSIKAESLSRVIFNKNSLEKEIYKQFCMDSPTDSPSLMDAAAYIYSQEYAIVCQLPSRARSLRVLDASEIHLREWPDSILELVNIRYLSLNCKSLLPPLVSTFWNQLETLIFCPDEFRYVDIPDKLWELRKLKHFKLIGAIGAVTLHSALERLQTLSGVREKQSRVAHLIERIPNIKTLGLHCDGGGGGIDISSLHSLENLKIHDGEPILMRFPPSIAKLTLNECDINEDLMKVIGELPGLKVLKLQNCFWINSEVWETYEAGFPSLRFLQLDIANLRQWKTDQSHFPLLRHLVLRGSHSLKEIPSCIGDIPTLEIMEIDGCSEEAVASAREIREEQCELYCNDWLQVRIKPTGMYREY